MSGAITTYESAEFGAVRTMEEDGSVWFVASDVARAFGYRDSANMTRYLRDSEKGTRKASTPGGDQSVVVINEPGFYHALNMRRTACMRDPDARERVEAFQDWVNGEVLPAIRRDGAYVNPAGAESDEELFARAMRAADRIIAQREERIRALEAENEGMRPAAEFGRAVGEAEGCIDMGAMARLLQKAGRTDLGRTNLFKRLRKDRVLLSAGGCRNYPAQNHIDAGRFTVVEGTYTAPDGTHTYIKTMVTPKGQEWLLRVYAGVGGALPVGDDLVAT